jgi:hypothetical protein
MISRLVTVDLILTMSERLHLVPRCRDLELRQLYDVSTPILNRWAKRIEAEGLSVSLSAITENALVYFSLPNNQSELADIGDRIITCAGQVESLLCGERSMRLLMQTTLLQELENAAKSGNSIEWVEAAREITTAKKNQTNASERLQKYFRLLLTWDKAEDGSPYRDLLTKGVNGEKPRIPKQLVQKLKTRFPGDRKLLRSFKAK